MSATYDLSIDTIDEDTKQIYEGVKLDYYKNDFDLGGGQDKTIRRVKVFYVGQDRLKHLSVLSDLGLKIYGDKSWREIYSYDLDLAMCFDKTLIKTMQQNEWVYNTSKIAVNISHPQATTAFSWRVMDVMATNACLLMEDKPDWCDLFGKYISSDVKNAIIYSDRFDMREKAIRLLNDEALRLRCVAECQNAIEQNGRWHHRFSDLERLLSVPLLNISDKTVSCFVVASSFAVGQSFDACDATDDADTDKKENPGHAFGFVDFRKKKVRILKMFRGFKLRKRYSNLFYLFMLMLAQLPILDLFIKKKKRLRFLEKIHKNWR